MAGNSIGYVAALFLLLTSVSHASGIKSLNASLFINGTQLHGQEVSPMQQASAALWVVNATFFGDAQSIDAVLNSSQINYTSSTGITSEISTPLRLTWAANPATEAYVLTNSTKLPIYLLASNETRGSVSASGQFSSATAAPACSKDRLYCEWDFYFTIQQNYSSGQKNVVVGRTCFYQLPIGYAQMLPVAPSEQLSSTLTLTNVTGTQVLLLNYNSTNTSSVSGAVAASWPASHVSVPVAPPNGSDYYAISNLNASRWYVQPNSVFAKWDTQYYSFALGFISRQVLFYSPSSIGVLSQSCNSVPSTVSNSTITAALQCMNSTAQVYYSKANSYAAGLFSSSQKISAYTANAAEYMGQPAIIIYIPSVFILQPRLTLRLSGSFAGVAIPAGRPAIISANATKLDTLGMGTITVQVENTGSSTALFNVTLEDCPGIKTQKGVSYQRLRGEGLSISTGVTASNIIGLINESCTVVVNDLTGGGSAAAQVNVVSGTGENIINGIYGFFKSMFDWLKSL